jgi:hypothetical protein
MARIRFGVRSLIIAVAALSVPAAFFRPGADHDPTFLSVTYCAIIVAGFVQLLIYAMSLVSLPISGDSIKRPGETTPAPRPVPRNGAHCWEGRALTHPEFGLGPEQQVGGSALDE